MSVPIAAGLMRADACDRRAASKARIAAGLRTFNVLADVVGLTELLIHAGHLVENNLHDPAHEELEGALQRNLPVP